MPKQIRRIFSHPAFRRTVIAASVFLAGCANQPKPSAHSERAPDRFSQTPQRPLTEAEKAQKIDEGMRLLIDQRLEGLKGQDPHLTYALDVQELQPIDRLSVKFKDPQGADVTGEISVLPIDITVNEGQRLPGMEKTKDGRYKFGGYKWLIELKFTSGEFAKSTAGLMIFTKYGASGQWPGHDQGLGDLGCLEVIQSATKQVQGQDPRIEILVGVLEGLKQTMNTTPPFLVPNPNASEKDKKAIEDLNRRLFSGANNPLR